MRRSDFEYSLPAALIAQEPLAQRSASRLLRLDGATGACSDHRFAELPGLLEPDDLLVFNDTRVVPARLAALRSTGGRVELLLERALAGHEALVQARPSNRLRPGQELASPGGTLKLGERRGELWQVTLPGPALDFFERHGQVPLPPYIDRPAGALDRERYQSLFARVPGAVAAPTASLHFDAAVLEALRARGVASALVTLHVGAGTFQPLRGESLEEHHMHAEWYQVPAATVAAVDAARAAGRRVIAVGTTVARALESATSEAPDGTPQLAAGSGETALFIRPGYRFRAIDGLVTNFHLPGSTLLMLVAALAGFEAVRDAYRHAIEHAYRFYSYGDAMLVWPREALPR